MMDRHPPTSAARANLDPAQGLARDETAATTLEWALLLAAIALPSYYILSIALETLIGHYRMITTITALPLP